MVKVDNITVKYMTGDFRDMGIKEYLIRKFTGKYEAKEFAAVKNVSFELDRGDFLGIIGTNGSGKTTLLKAVSGVLFPEEGEIELDGNVSALLSLGTGFDGELNLKENIYFRGALLGYTEEFIDEKYPEIIEFSELKEYENRKLKQLSSGMKSKLMFSIASLINPDILILDEVLAVGDAAFRVKSERKMMEIIKGGTTTLFVSHSLGQIRRLANKVLWLNKGEQMAFGDAQKVCDEYEQFINSLQN